MPRSLWICHCKIELSAPVRETSVLHLLQQVVNSADKWNVSCVPSLGGFTGRQMLLFVRGSNAGHGGTGRAGLFSRREHTALLCLPLWAGLHDPAQTSWSWSPPSATSSPWDRCTAVAATNKQPAFACLKFAIRASLCSVGNTVCDSSEAVFQQSCKQNFVRATNTNIRIFFTHGKAFLFVSRWKFQ